MNGEGFLFIGIIIFLFVVWAATGGPMRPISFAGPYITPLTNVGLEQHGYGSTTTFNGISGNYSGSVGSAQGSISYTATPVSEGQLQGLQSQIADLEKKVNQERLYGDPSPYHGQVTLSSGNLGATDPDQQYVSIYNSGGQGESVTVSGWHLVSLATDKSVIIPYGDALPSNTTASPRAPIMLAPGDQAIISTGKSPIGASFRENECSGYLAQTQTFYPYLNSSCPAPRDEFDRFYTGNKYKDSGCYDLVNSLGSCRAPAESGNLSSACYSFIDTHLSYAGCVATHQYDPGFTGHVWHIYLNYRDATTKGLNNNSLLWRSNREAIKLTDSNGKTVDLYASY